MLNDRKANVSVEQAMKTQRVDVHLYSFFNLSARWGWVVNGTPRPLYSRERDRGRCGRVRKISSPTGIRSPKRPFRSESLYRLSYPGTRLDTRDRFVMQETQTTFLSSNCLCVNTPTIYLGICKGTNTVPLECNKTRYPDPTDQKSLFEESVTS